MRRALTGKGLYIALISLFILASCHSHKQTRESSYARYIPERADDFAWENDLVAFRAYGPAMRDRPEDSGIDCWLKRVHYPIIDKWYKQNVEKKSYHRDHGEGYDPYHVGSSRGCGGLGLWARDSLISSDTYTEWKIIKQKTKDTKFVLSYEWQYAGDHYKEEKQISIRLGNRYYEAVSTFWKNGKIAVNLPIAIGITTHDGKAEVSRELSSGWLACWENIDGYGLGTGIMMNPKHIREFKLVDAQRKDEGNALFITETDKEGQVHYQAGYGWEKAGEIKSFAEWQSYLSEHSLFHTTK